MKFNFLKRLRQLTAGVAVSLILLSFLDFGGWLPTAFYRWVNSLQFVPSLLKFLHLPALLSAGFAVVLVFTVLWGRVYCSWVCPLGILQDFVSRLPKKRRKKKGPFHYTKPYRILQYSVLIVVVALALAGIAQGVVLTDPYSVFGRMAHHLILPLATTANNLLSSVFENFGSYVLKPYAHPGFHLIGFLFALLLFGIIGWLSYTKGRLYCTAWCPVGTLLGLVSRFSLYKIHLDHSKCTHCGLCGAACKSGCIDTKNRVVDFDRCVGCFNCLTTCSGKGVVFGIPPRGNEPTTPANTGRRKALWLIITGTIGLALHAAGQTLEKAKKAFIPNEKKSPVSPPGSMSVQRFNNICTACHLCVGACPTHVLQPSLLQYGLKGFMQPHMDYHASFCNYDCTRCSEVCPTGAIQMVTKEEKKAIQIGKARFIEKNCVVYTDGTACGACSEHCPTKAVDMVPYRNGLTIPIVYEDICVGCGACEFACPTMPFKAIFVDGNPVHPEAKPPQGHHESPEEVPEEFPF
jgi:polyferredoxin